MPLFEYKCKSCREISETFVAPSADTYPETMECPICHDDADRIFPTRGSFVMK